MDRACVITKDIYKKCEHLKCENTMLQYTSKTRTRTCRWFDLFQLSDVKPLPNRLDSSPKTVNPATKINIFLRHISIVNFFSH